MPDDDLIDKLLAQLPAPYPLSTGRSSNETSLPSVRRERTVAPTFQNIPPLRVSDRGSSSELEPGEIASTHTAGSSPLDGVQKGPMVIRPAPGKVDVVKELPGIKNPLSSLLHSQVPAGPKPVPGTPQDRFKNSVLANPLMGTKSPRAPGSWGGPQPVFRSHAGHTFFSQSQERVKGDVPGGFGGLQAPGKAKAKVATATVAKPSVGSSEHANDQTLQTRSTSASRPSTNIPFGNVPRGPKKDQPQALLAPEASVSYDVNAKKKLSLRCQSLGFNPEWVLGANVGGKCSFNVKLRDVMVESDGLYIGEQMAKAVVAVKALRDSELWRKLERWSRPPASSKASATSHANGFSATSTSNSRQNKSRQHNSRQNLPLVKREPGILNGAASRTTEESERLQLLIMLQNYIGPSVPNYADRPDVCKAFFEGLAMGARLTRPSQSPSEHIQKDRAGSRSPPTRHSNISASYRARSPLGVRGRLTPPPVYFQYPGRPDSSYYRPCNTPRREPPRGPSGDSRGNTVVKKE
ncbi:uncharacterized protein B0T23DRAFT_80835 [Neurospora hispaniola]|uniref:Uncharacterized protein n=1 Tax=Neurospora hispaniola TaxID=588809 RepID=A0AAJ0MU82_9PEZI|nr:hypothetical protein B0T23DRAFT_80835 [Neurospora hispaniola]